MFWSSFEAAAQRLSQRVLVDVSHLASHSAPGVRSHMVRHCTAVEPLHDRSHSVRCVSTVEHFSPQCDESVVVQSLSHPRRIVVAGGCVVVQLRSHRPRTRRHTSRHSPRASTLHERSQRRSGLVSHTSRHDD
jgi:hypothetical protein